ncbi:hypothetical protein B0H19DRAFT_1064168 [Mycena capillaripes]|nr:hypothetical protein B0H19DRAFT_1064168 [Mycena capillaripes]
MNSTIALPHVQHTAEISTAAVALAHGPSEVKWMDCASNGPQLAFLPLPSYLELTQSADAVTVAGVAEDTAPGIVRTGILLGMQSCCHEDGQLEREIYCVQGREGLWRQMSAPLRVGAPKGRRTMPPPANIHMFHSILEIQASIQPLIRGVSLP